MLTIGPFKSKRLGWSLGIYPVPEHICSFHCIYCSHQSPRVTQTRREEFYSLPALVDAVSNHPELNKCDYVSILGNGEPTLYWLLGSLLRRLKKRIDIPVAVFTNGSLLYRREVRQDLEMADQIFVKLDAADNTTFQRINFPHDSIYFRMMLEGISRLCLEHKNKVSLEFNVLAGFNDSVEHLEMFRLLIDSLDICQVYIKTPICPPAVYRAGLHPLADPARVQKSLGRGEILFDNDRREISVAGYLDFESALNEILKRMYLPLSEARRMAERFGTPEKLSALLDRGEIEEYNSGETPCLISAVSHKRRITH